MKVRAVSGTGASAHALVTIAASAAFVSEAGYAALDRAILGHPWAVQARLVHAGACLVMIGLLIARRERPVPALTYGAYAITIAPFLPIYWVVEAFIARQGMPWTPFVGFKYILLPIALLTPPPTWLALLTIAAFCSEAVLLSIVLRFAEHPVVAAGEPWPTLLFGVIALVVVAQRAQTRAAAIAAERAHAERAAYEWLATVFMALRDGSNTPLQTLAVAVELLRRRHPEETQMLARMERSLQRLQEINDTVASCEAQMPQVGTHVASFDSKTQLARFEEMLRRRPH